MARHNEKGREGEHSLVEMLNDITLQFGYEWYRTPSPERNKKTRYGDVNLIPKKGNEKCVLEDFLFDAQKSDTLTPVAKLKKLMDELPLSGRSHAVYYGKETSGSGKPNFEMIAMPVKTFKNLIVYLQGYVQEEAKGD